MERDSSYTFPSVSYTHLDVYKRQAQGGPIALGEEGDIISIDIPACKIELKVDEAALAARRAKWVCPEPKINTGYLARYAKLVTSAARGAVLE